MKPRLPRRAPGKRCARESSVVATGEDLASRNASRGTGSHGRVRVVRARATWLGGQVHRGGGRSVPAGSGGAEAVPGDCQRISTRTAAPVPVWRLLLHPSGSRRGARDSSSAPRSGGLAEETVQRPRLASRCSGRRSAAADRQGVRRATTMSAEDVRKDVIRDVVELRGSLPDLAARLRTLPWDCEQELVVVQPEHLTASHD